MNTPYEPTGAPLGRPTRWAKGTARGSYVMAKEIKAALDARAKENGVKTNAEIVNTLVRSLRASGHLK